MVKRLFLGLLVVITVAVSELEALSIETINEAYYTSYALEKAEDYSRAIEALSPIYEVYPNSYTINFRFGWLRYLQGHFADALAHYRKALAIYPASVEVMSCISLVHKDRFDWTKVEEENSKILKIDNFNKTANYWYAYALKSQKKHKQAQSVCMKMLTIYPTDVTFLFLMGKIMFEVGNAEKSLYYFGSVITLDPYNTGAKEYIAKLIEN